MENQNLLRISNKKDRPKKRCYFVSSDMMEEEGTGIAIIATNAKEAKIYFRKHYDYDEYISITVKWRKQAEVADLPYGICNLREGLIRGVYGYIYTECDLCHKEACIYIDDYTEAGNRFLCEYCRQEMKNQNHKKLVKK